MIIEDLMARREPEIVPVALAAGNLVMNQVFCPAGSCG
jgi:hypothetical protein